MFKENLVAVCGSDFQKEGNPIEKFSWIVCDEKKNL